MKPKIYIDGKEGTTGLQIYERLGGRDDIDLLVIDEAKRKDIDERRKYINAADLVFLCLPDAAAVEAVALRENPSTRIIDASTAHRVDSQWVYGMPELNRRQRENIKNAALVANPGCHATGVIMLTAPLVSEGIMPADYPLTVSSLTGYSGGGKKMIAQYQASDRDEALDAPRVYGLDLHHKHLKEIIKYTGLDYAPVFSPIVCDYYAGMETVISIHNRLLNRNYTAQNIQEILSRHYDGENFVAVHNFSSEKPVYGGFLNSNAMVGTNNLEIYVCGDEQQTLLLARFDNLGKGASGAAVQNMNIMLGFDEKAGLQ